MNPTPDPASDGIEFLAHTADVGIEVHAPTPRALFERAARGMVQLLVEAPPPPDTSRTLALEATDLGILLRAWLRALLRWHEDGFTPGEVSVESLDRDALGRWTLAARIAGGAAGGHPLREIKGVTLHGLAAEERRAGWYGRIIFDV